jgi:hypothetical protein
MSKREYVGSIYTDVACIVVGDPCKMLQSRNGNPRTYEELGDARISQFRDRERDPRQPVALGSDLIALPTVENCDGWINVYVERDKSGWPMRMVIDLASKTRPGLTLSETE